MKTLNGFSFPAEMTKHIQKGSAKARAVEKVKARQVIVVARPTGYLVYSGPHLHFEVHRYNGPGQEDYGSIGIRWRDCDRNK